MVNCLPPIDTLNNRRKNLGKWKAGKEYRALLLIRSDCRHSFTTYNGMGEGVGPWMEGKGMGFRTLSH
jgi:hypothetical protein